MPEPKTNRNDSVLNTGMSSALDRKQRIKALEQKSKREQRRAQLTPSAEIVLDWIEREKAEVTERVAALPINMDTKEQDIKSVLLAYQMHLTFLGTLKAKANNMLRTVPQNGRVADPNAPEAWVKAAAEGEKK